MNLYTSCPPQIRMCSQFEIFIPEFSIYGRIKMKPVHGKGGREIRLKNFFILKCFKRVYLEENPAKQSATNSTSLEEACLDFRE